MFKILLATDGSAGAYRAAEYAGVLAGEMEDAEITVLGVVDLDVGSYAALSASGLPVIIPTTLFAEIEKATRAVLEDTRQKLASTGRKVETRLERGKPAQVICDLAEKGNFNLIVMGSRGLGHIAGIFLGSVSDKVLHNAAVPVLIVRSREDREK